MQSSSHPSNEVMLLFGKDTNGCVIVNVFDVHGEAMQAAVNAAGFAPTKLLGANAIAQTGNIIKAMKQLNLERTPILAAGKVYQRYTFHAAIVADSTDFLA